MRARIPTATYRVQFNRDFRFADAEKLVDYLNELGVSDLYASPIFKARTGSVHGYDVTDPTQFNPELGTSEDFDRLSRRLREHDMGLLLDIVPNHMAASLENPWWFDVLEKGANSPHAAYFDVNWQSNKILLPILSRPYDEALELREIELQIVNGRPVIQYLNWRLPVAVGENPRSRPIDDVLADQHYRLAFWRKASDDINYRRFFDVSELIGLCAEKEAVFKATHSLVLKLLDEKKVTGLRVDHIDGLLDPKGYLDRLRNTYVVAEKILSGNEQPPGDWNFHGTTGYDFLNVVNGAFIDPAGYRQLEKIYLEFTGSTATYTQVFHERKLQVMQQLFAAEVNAFVQRLSELAEEDRQARAVSRQELKNALVNTIAAMPVYRTYIRDFEISERDRIIIEDALKAAGCDRAVAFLRRVLLLDPAWYLNARRREYLDFTMRWQQFTGPVMAKGLEDTAFYVHNPLVSANEVGGDPSGPSNYLGVEEFHRHQIQRTTWPDSMNAGSTHDTKRSEDVRARINVLSELHQDWARRLRRWQRMNPCESAPDHNEQILIYQNLLGAWPIEPERFKQYVIKALREAKTHTSWLQVNHDYERSVLGFVDRLYSSEAFQRDSSPLGKKMAYFGALNSLSQLVLKITAPGVPDFYQGSELWNLSLSDPDNRRPIDYTARIQLFNELKRGVHPRELLRKWQDGRIKMYVAWKALNFRRSHPDLFCHGEYIPLRVTGMRENHVIAFARRHRSQRGEQWIIVAVPRLVVGFNRTGAPPIGEKTWRDTAIELPPDAPHNWSNILTNEQSGERLTAPLTAASLFSVLPLAFVSSTYPENLSSY